MGSLSSETKPHAVCIPYPAQGHVTPMLSLAKLLHSLNFHITFVNTEYNHRRLLRSRGPHSLDGLPDFQFKTIQDGLPFSDEDTTQDVPSLCKSTMTACLPHLRDLIHGINDPSSGLPRVSCVVSDLVMSFALDAAKEIGVPCVQLWTASACGFMGYLHYRKFIERGLVPFKEADQLNNKNLEAPIDWIPGMKNMRLRDIPSFIRTTDPNDIMLNFVIYIMDRAAMASAIVINTFDELEHSVLQQMETMLPPIYTIGPISKIAWQIKDSSLESLGSNLWKEQPGCVEWLEGKKPGSIVYVNFGSVTVMTNQQLVEFAWGLANSKHEFLWIIRPDLVKGETAVLPQEYLEEIKERGLLASWCPQEDVLMHPSIGGFLTHSGWNSTLESISGGVPMMSWPFFAEQQTNCRYVCKEWGIGMEIDNDVKRDEVEGLIRELMEGEKGKEMRKRAMEWKERAIRATQPGGPSSINLEKVVKEVLVTKKLE